MDELHSRYASGISNWDWLDHKILKEEDTAFKSTGLMVYAAEMEWIAIKIKSPGKGLHTVGMNYAISRNGGTGAIYILPADTEDIGSALDIDNRVGIVSFTDMNGETTVVDAGQTYAGTWEFGEDDEYIMVIEAYKDTIFEINRCYMMISEVFMTPGDIMKQTEEVKVISPVTIDPGPVKILESCYYGMTTKVNGCNYLYMPTEGKKCWCSTWIMTAWWTRSTHLIPDATVLISTPTATSGPLDRASRSIVIMSTPVLARRSSRWIRSTRKRQMPSI